MASRSRPQKTVIITGGNSGLGYECAKNLANNKDWHVIIACRNRNTATEAVEQLIIETGNKDIEQMTLDLASLDSIRQFAKDFAIRDLPPLRALVCNAGIQIVTGITYTQDGFETTFGVNHLGHFLLVNLLLRQLVAPARIVIVSSGVHDPTQTTGLPMTDLPAPRYTDPKSLAWPDTSQSATTDSVKTAGRRRYSTSKLCSIYCTYELSRRLQTEGHSTKQRPITVNAFEPGMMPGSGLARDYDPLQRFGWSFVLPLFTPFFPNINTTKTSGKALAQLILAPELEAVSGKYFAGTKQIPSSKESYDEKKAVDLWETSADLVKLMPDETILQCNFPVSTTQ